MALPRGRVAAIERLWQRATAAVMVAAAILVVAAAIAVAAIAVAATDAVIHLLRVRER